MPVLTFTYSPMPWEQTADINNKLNMLLKIYRCKGGTPLVLCIPACIHIRTVSAEKVTWVNLLLTAGK